MNQITSANGDRVIEQYRHPQFGIVEIGSKYSDLWCGIRIDTQELVSCNPAMLTAIGSTAGVLDVEVIDVMTDANLRQQPAVNINTCTPRQLADRVDGIGPAKAGRIIARRPPNGYGDYEAIARVNQDLGLNWAEIAADNVIKFND